MSESETPQEEVFLDDRMFVLAVYPARLAKDKEENHQTVIFYDQTPENGLWTVLTFRNVEGYPLVGVAHFEKEEHARLYKAGLEPSIPLTSLGGQSPKTQMPAGSHRGSSRSHQRGRQSPCSRQGEDARHGTLAEDRFRTTLSFTSSQAIPNVDPPQTIALGACRTADLGRRSPATASRFHAAAPSL